MSLVFLLLLSDEAQGAAAWIWLWPVYACSLAGFELIFAHQLRRLHFGPTSTCGALFARDDPEPAGQALVGATIKEAS
jgi:hypothetical protein